MNLEGRQKLVQIVKRARGSMSQRAFGKLLGVSATAVQLWEKGVTIPETENLAQIAARAGYTLEELLCTLEGKPLPEISKVNEIVKQINSLPISQIAAIGKAVMERLAAEAEAARR